MKIYQTFLSVFFTGAFLFPASALAAGFYIQESSVSGLGHAFAGSTTSLKDASTIFFNPAGMTRLDGAQMNVGAHLLVPHADITNTGSTFDFNGAAPGGVGPITGGNGGDPYRSALVPNMFVAAPMPDDHLWLGIGVSAPFGLGSSYDDGWFGRFDSTKTELTTMNIQPSIAVKVHDQISIGVGIDIQKADAVLERAISNIVSEGVSRLEGDDWSYGFNAGLLISPWEHTDIGVHYRSHMHHELDGRIKVAGLTSGNFDVPGTADLDLPDMWTFGLAQQYNDKLRLMGQLTWFGWNSFKEIRAKNDSGGTISVVPQNYENTLALALGLEYQADDQWTWRAGYQYDPTPTQDGFRTSRTPDGDRNWFTAGGTYHWKENISIDFSSALIDVGEEELNLVRNSNLANITADTNGTVGIFSIGVNYRF